MHDHSMQPALSQGRKQAAYRESEAYAAHGWKSRVYYGPKHEDMESECEEESEESED